MGYAEHMRILKMALDLKMIGVGQFNEVMEEWEKDPTRDIATCMLDKNYISKEQYNEILSMMAAGKDPSLKPRNSSGEKSEPEKISKDEVVYAKNYLLKGILGEGGVGCVFLGYDKNIGREVAIKEIILDRDEKQKEVSYARFVREAKITGQLEHPGIVPVYELSKKEDGTVYYVMKHVKGKTLFEAIKEAEGGTPEESFRRRMLLFGHLINVCEAMGYAHSKGIIHRDLKPSNIILGEFGETIILDWGTAKQLKEGEPSESRPNIADFEESDSEELTRQGELLGTPSYMAPEQIDARYGSVNTATDVYALGTILYILLTGDKPYRGRGKEILEKIINMEEAPKPLQDYKFIPPELAAICRKAMSKDQKDRFQNASQMVAELKAYRDGRIVSVYSYSKGELLRRFVAKNKVALMAAAAVIISIITGAGFALNYAVEAQKAKRAAESALTDITKLTEATMPLARGAVIDINTYYHNLLAEMGETAQSLSMLNLGKAESIMPYLQELEKHHPFMTSFMVILPPGAVIASFPEKDTTKYNLSSDQYKDLINQFNLHHVVVGKIIKISDELHVFPIYYPIKYGNRVVGVLTAIGSSENTLAAAMPFDPLKSEYQVWCMDENGIIIYDEDSKQIGRDLFRDEMFTKFPELMTFGEKMRKEPWGVGYYRFYERGKGKVIYKIAAWDTFTPAEDVAWKIVVSYPYVTK